MRVYCSLSTVLRFAFWTVIVGIVIGVLLVNEGARAQSDKPGDSGAGISLVERGCVTDANPLTHAAAPLPRG